MDITPSTPAAFRALRGGDELAAEWTEERRLDLILAVVVGDLSLGQAARLAGVARSVVAAWRDELLYDGAPPA